LAANLTPVSLTAVANFPPVNNTNGTRVNDTGVKFAAGIIDTRGCTLTCEYLCKFSKTFEMTLMLFSGAWGKIIHEKNLKKKCMYVCMYVFGKDLKEWGHLTNPS
jgi:hypothetical protein